MLEVVDDSDVVCVAKNEALLDGLLTVFHVERSSDELLNLQNDLPLLSEYDKECLISLAVVSIMNSGFGLGHSMACFLDKLCFCHALLY